MKIKLICIFVLIFLCKSCKNKSEKNNDEENKVVDTETVVNFNEIISDYNTWWSYHYHKINLSSDFIPVDSNSKIIDKSSFLENLTSGNYITIELKTNDSIPKYKLFELPKDIPDPIKTTIKSTSAVTYNYHQMEGLNFPEFNFSDINGNEYKNEQLKGKITVLKTWFIACVPCVKEFPELNNLVDKYSNNENVQFISLATDTKQPLNSFLEKKEFKYTVVPNQKEFIEQKIKSKIYPTHIIVDDKGVIIKVMNRASHMIAYLKSITDLTESQTKKKLAPPPPPPMPNKNDV
ncbi:TlpA family protein disulfide reductase [Meridianimaribacter flavus]